MRALVSAVVILAGCTAAQREAFLRDLEQQAGEVCLEHDDWAACLRKCKDSPPKETPSDAPAARP
jgi:hypothetical protein